MARKKSSAVTVTNDQALAYHNQPFPQSILPISVLESPGGFLVRADLPGVPRERIRVDFELGNLFIEADLYHELDPKEEILLQELAPCRLKRTLKMSSEIDGESIKASFEQGVLTIILPKKKTAQRQRISISDSAN